VVIVDRLARDDLTAVRVVPTGEVAAELSGHVRIERTTPTSDSSASEPQRPERPGSARPVHEANESRFSTCPLCTTQTC
jgi:hypothetical protein